MQNLLDLPKPYDIKNDDIKDVCGSKWLTLKETTYKDKNGNDQKWQFVARSKNEAATGVVARTEKSGKFLFIVNGRVPMNKWVIGFPGGLVKPGEDIVAAANRELKDETGYKCKRVLTMNPPSPKSAGLTTEQGSGIGCIVDDKAAGKTELESTEKITHFWATAKQFFEIMEKVNPETTVASSGTWSYMSGYLDARGRRKKKE